MVSQIHTIDIIQTDTEFEALLLEAQLVKTILPKYNSQLRDDKSPLYIAITKHAYPKVSAVRQSDIPPKLTAVFGPFLSSRQVMSLLRRIRKLFPYCAKIRDDGRACFYTHLGLCPGACNASISLRAYQKHIHHICDLLSGNIGKLKKTIMREMRDAVKRQKYEVARDRRDLLTALNQLLRKPSEYGEDIAYQPHRNRNNRLCALVAVLKEYGIDSSLETTRVEGYDVSNLGGRQATASMVVFVRGEPENREYRHFRVRTLWTPDDPRMLAEIIGRRLLHNEWEKPGLIVVDGGEPQLRALQQQFHISTHLPGNIPFVGLSKERETIVIPRKPALTNFLHVQLPRSHPGLQLVMHIRDESHRFARVLHHRLRSKSVLGYNNGT